LKCLKGALFRINKASNSTFATFEDEKLKIFSDSVKSIIVRQLKKNPVIGSNARRQEKEIKISTIH